MFLQLMSDDSIYKKISFFHEYSTRKTKTNSMVLLQYSIEAFGELQRPNVLGKASEYTGYTLS